MLAGGELAGGALAGAAPLSEGAAAGAVEPDGLDIEPDELSDGAAAAGAAGALLCEGAGGAAAGSVLEDGFFAQAVSSSAAASALRATLVFIDRYPDTLLREPLHKKALLNDFLSFRESFTGRAAEFYRVTMGLETV